MGRETALKGACAALLGALALWLFSPLATCVPVEGFSASIGSIALHLTHDDIRNYDRLFPFNFQFFAFSRLGVNLFVALLAGPLGLPAEWALRLTMGSGAACFVAGVYLLARRWSGASPLVVVLLMLLTPGVAETGFFYNDNLLSAGLALLALALLAGPGRIWSDGLAGLLFGYAMLSRTDAVLLAPAAGLILWRREESLNERLIGRAAMLGLASAGVFVAVLAVFGLNPLNLLHIASHAVKLWDRPLNWAVHALSILWFCGPIVLALSLLGVGVLARARQGFLLLLIVGEPLLYNLVYLGKVWEARQLAPLAPFFVTAAAFGLRPFLAPRAGGGRLSLWLLAAAAGLLLLAPSEPHTVREGPRAMLGRLWSPIVWRRWQDGVRRSFDAVGALVAAPPAARSVIATDTWDADRYTHLQLQEHGYRPFDLAAGGYPACAPVAEGFVRGGTEIIHLRLHTPFLNDWRQREVGRYAGAGRACIAEAGGPVIMVSNLSRLQGLFDLGRSPWAEQAAGLRGAGVDALVGVRLSPAMQAALPGILERDAAHALALDPSEAARRPRPQDAGLAAIR
ncbi:MAG: glycosyltransferase family 39 protein [Caulobacteraceae bacterium]|nr:glycosyltransferase family 39 protein [Caulobacteraceae bacterium]